MNEAQKLHAAAIAKTMIEEGADPQGLVHVQFYPEDYQPGECEVQGVSTPLPAESDLSGYTSRYYTLEELAR